MNPQLPPVDPAVTAELVAALTPRLRKRLDAGVTKVAGRPAVREGDVVRVAVDDDTDLELHAPGGVVTSAGAIRCGCLLAPDCLHRAAAASAAPIADPPQPLPADTPSPPPTGPPQPAPTGQADPRTAGPADPSAMDPADAPTTGLHPNQDPAHRPANGPADPSAAGPARPPADDPTDPTATGPNPGPAHPPAAGRTRPPAADPAHPPTTGPTLPPAAGRTGPPATGLHPNPDPAQPATVGPAQQPATGPDRSAVTDPSQRQGHDPAHPAPTALTPAPDAATAEQRAAAADLWDAVGAVLEAGTDGAGAVVQAELLRAAHTARLAGLPRAAGRAVSVVTALRAARSADAAYRLADLAAALRDVLRLAHRLPHAGGRELSELRGSVRQPYTPKGSLRLYGLFSEPVLTATGYAGAVTWTADATGRLHTVSDVAPGGAGRATGAADRGVRIGDTTLTHRELSRAGLVVSGATVSPTGRLGAGAGVRAVRASGAAWHAEPLDRLWAVPVAEQVSRALTTDQDLLFLDVTLSGTVREAAGECLIADCAGLTLRLAAAHDDPALPHRENLRLLASARGCRLRVVARLTPAPFPRALLLAVSHPTDPGTRVDLGLDRLRRADLPAPVTPAAVSAPDADEAPVHLLRRRVHQAVSGGRRVLAFPGGGDADGARLRRNGLATAGELLDALHAAAADRSRDAFGRLLPADTGRFARAWLAAAVCTEELDRALCAAAWGVQPGRRDAS
ncbi:hypothetical protein AB0D84_04575 [Streptomyces sp. NPDC048193]|uniref:hypothetical protein n=1 Tax=unclassified Streptomyces TaxID=2593676 RepID=UPI00341A08A7